MAGPSYTGVRTVIDPFEGLQKAVSNAGDIYREYEKSSREADIHNAKMQEVERVNHQRDFLRNYDPQLGVQGRGLSDDAKRFAQAEEERIVQHFAEAAARGEEVPSPEELRKRISADYGKLATQESAQQAIMQDFLAQGFEPAEAAAYAQSLTGGLASRASLYEQEKDRVEALQKHYEAIREAGKNTLELQFKGIEANAKILDAENKAKYGYYRNGSRTTGTKDPGREQWEEADKFSKALTDKLGWLDGPSAVKVIHEGLDAYNQNRLEADLPPLPRSEAYNLAYEDIGKKWFIDNDLGSQTPGAFQVLLEERFDNNPGAFRRGQYGGGGSWGTGGAGSSVMTQLDPNSANMLRNVVMVQPRSMTEIEKARVQETFKDYIPRPQTATQSADTVTTTASVGGTSTNTSQQGTGGTSGKKGGAEAAREVEDAIKRRDELLAGQDATAEALRREQEAARAAAEEAAADRSFLADTSLPVEERVRMLRSQAGSRMTAEQEEALNNLTQRRDQTLAAIEKNAQRMEVRRAQEEDGGRRNNPMIMNLLTDEEARLTSRLDRLNSEINGLENQVADTFLPIEELLPRGVYNLEDGAGVSPKAAEITREFLKEYEDTLYAEVPAGSSSTSHSMFGGVSDIATTNARRHNAPNDLLNKVEQTAQNIAVVDPALAEEIRRAAIFGKEQVDGRRTLMYNLQDEHRKLGVTEEDLVNRRSVETVPEARAGLDQLIDATRKLQEYLRVR